MASGPGPGWAQALEWRCLGCFHPVKATGLGIEEPGAMSWRAEVWVREAAGCQTLLVYLEVHCSAPSLSQDAPARLQANPSCLHPSPAGGGPETLGSGERSPGPQGETGGAGGRQSADQPGLFPVLWPSSLLSGPGARAAVPASGLASAVALGPGQEAAAQDLLSHLSTAPPTLPPCDVPFPGPGLLVWLPCPMVPLPSDSRGLQRPVKLV